MQIIHFIAQCFYCLVIPRDKGGRLALALTVMSMFMMPLTFGLVLLLVLWLGLEISITKVGCTTAFGLCTLLMNLGLHRFYTGERRGIARQFALVRGLKKHYMQCLLL